jgi:hypothetical protein
VTVQRRGGPCGSPTKVDELDYHPDNPQAERHLPTEVSVSPWKRRWAEGPSQSVHGKHSDLVRELRRRMTLCAMRLQARLARACGSSSGPRAARGYRLDGAPDVPCAARDSALIIGLRRFELR